VDDIAENRNARRRNEIQVPMHPPNFFHHEGDEERLTLAIE